MKRTVLAAALLLCWGNADSREFTRADYTASMETGTRSRITMPFFYSEVQYKYGLFHNLLGIYIDRPLFHDRATRYPANKYSYITPESYFRDIAIMKRYGFDGAGSLALPIFGLYKTVMGYLEKYPQLAVGHKEFPQFAFSGSFRDFSPKDTVFTTACAILDIALKSPFTPRVNGRIPITTYCAWQANQDAMEAFIKALRAKYGDVFALIGSYGIDWKDQEEYNQTGKWSDSTVQKYRRRIEKALRLYDGLQVEMCWNRTDGEYMTHEEFGAYDRYLLPILQKLTAMPEFRQKLIGACVRQGYINHMSGVTHGEFGTASLRGKLDRIMLLNPDFIYFFEWNEFNENTCYQPTLANSLALQRLLKFYIRHLKGLTPEPNPGDDPAVPQLVLSHRSRLKTGEPLQFELLNIPDGIKKDSYSVRLHLRNLSGKNLISFPAEKFRRDQLRAVTYTVPTEKLMPDFVFIPELEVTGYDGKSRIYRNFQYILVNPTVNSNYKSVRQPLRDMLVAGQVVFEAESIGDGRFRLKGKFKAAEKLNSLEVTDRGLEVYACDPVGEFDRSRQLVLTGWFTTRNKGWRPMTLEMVNGGDWKMRAWEQANVNFGTIKKNGNRADCHIYCWTEPSGFILTLPKEQADKAEFRISVDGETKTFKVADLLAQRRIDTHYPKCRLQLENYLSLPDIPVHIERDSAEFDIVLESQNRYPVYQLRAVSESGRIYRSAPVMPVAVPEKTEMLNVNSETSGKVVSVPVRSALIPRLKWKFDNRDNAVLFNSFHPYFTATLGGGYKYDDAFHYIADPSNGRGPVRMKEDNRDILKFDGKTYLHFPLETFPRGPFRLSFEIKPESMENPYVLFRHFSSILGSITVYVKFDRLYVSFTDRQLQTHNFASGVTVVPGKWSDIQIRYDLHFLTIKVNGQERFYPFEGGRALYFKPAVFGGHTKAEFGLPENAGYFKGALRALSIDHNI